MHARVEAETIVAQQGTNPAASGNNEDRGRVADNIALMRARAWGVCVILATACGGHVQLGEDNAPPGASGGGGGTGAQGAGLGPDVGGAAAAGGNAQGGALNGGSGGEAGGGAVGVGGAGGGGASGGAPQGGAPGCPVGEVQSCYGGRPDTIGVGLCASGTQLCTGSPPDWGTCLGSILPSPEICDSGLDEDCDGWTSQGCNNPPIDQESFAAHARAVAFDPAGDLVIGGGDAGPVLSIGATTVPAGPDHGFIAKLNPSLEATWVRILAGDQVDVRAVAVHASGAIAVVGHASGAVDLGGALLPAAGLDGFVAVYEPSGAFRWGQLLGGPKTQRALGVAMTPDGDVVVVGEHREGFTVGGTTMVSAGKDDGFAVRLAGASGDVTWAKSYGTSEDEKLWSVSTTPAGDLLLAGFSSAGGDLDLGGGATSTGDTTLMIAKLDGSGAHVWSHGFPHPRVNDLDIASGPTGDAYVTGGLKDGTDFGGGLLPADDDFFIARFDGSGQHLFSRVLGSLTGQLSNEFTSAVAVGSTGDFAVVGSLVASSSTLIDLGGGPFPFSDHAMFIAKYSGSGQHLWSETIGQNGRDLAIGPMGAIAMVGYSFAGPDVVLFAP